MVNLTCRDIAEAVNGKVLCGNPETVISRVSIDSRTVEENNLFVPLAGDNTDGHRFVSEAFKKGAAASFYALPYKKKEGDKVIIAVSDTLVALQKAAAHYRSGFNKLRIGAVTGSSGKTTTKDLMATVLREHFAVLKTEGNYNNHIGLPLTLFNLKSEHEVAVVELAMRGAGEIALLTKIASPQWAVITNIGEAHIERLGSVENIASAKGELLREMGKGGTAILNGDDPHLRRLGEEFKGEVFYYGFGEELHFRAEDYRINKEGSVFTVIFPDKTKHGYSLPLPGKHNSGNALAALAFGYLLGLKPREMNFDGWEEEASSGRLQTFIANRGALIIDDTYNANPVSMMASLQIVAEMDIKGNKVAVLGDMLELGGFSREKHLEIGAKVAETGLDFLITVGGEAAFIAEEAGKRGVRAVSCKNKEEAWQYLADLPLSGDDLIFLKGSRGMKLEELVQKLI